MVVRTSYNAGHPEGGGGNVRILVVGSSVQNVFIEKMCFYIA